MKEPGGGSQHFRMYNCQFPPIACDIRVYHGGVAHDDPYSLLLGAVTEA